MVRAGWLPGPLVERVSRQAVELLNLDAGEEPAAGTPERAAHGPAGAVPGGAFGPPDPSYGAVSGPSYEDGSGLVPFDSAVQTGAPATETSGVPARPAGPPVQAALTRRWCPAPADRRRGCRTPDVRWFSS
ncbi:hypothetical protein SAMN05428943_3277 [Streptomyces sp. 2314.4]|nr:hypothetical protein SAMN05428943_3277 [Streptomyces sp. 2314.4]